MEHRHTLIAACLALGLAVLPLAAQQVSPDAVPAAGSDADEGFSLMEEGAKLILREMMSDMEPAMRDMGQAIADMQEEVGPAMRELSRLLGDMSAYEMPEVLPNGDIIIRRKGPSIGLNDRGKGIDL